MPLDEQREQHRLAYHLPRPLFVLYRQTASYAEACGQWHNHLPWHGWARYGDVLTSGISNFSLRGVCGLTWAVMFGDGVG